MEMLLGFTLLASQAGAGFAASAEEFVYLAMQLALPLLRALGILVIIWGVVCAATQLVRMESRRLRGKEYKLEAISLRQHLVYYLLLGLEFLIAVDVIETLLNPDWNELGILGGLIVVRTLVSLSLTWELKDTEEDQQKEQQAARVSSPPADS